MNTTIELASSPASSTRAQHPPHRLAQQRAHALVAGLHVSQLGRRIGARFAVVRLCHRRAVVGRVVVIQQVPRRKPRLVHVKAVHPQHERLRARVAVLQEPAHVVRHAHRLRLILVAAPVIRMRVDVGQHRRVGVVPKLHPRLARVLHQVLDRIVQPQELAVPFVPAVEVMAVEPMKEVRVHQVRRIRDRYVCVRYPFALPAPPAAVVTARRLRIQVLNNRGTGARGPLPAMPRVTEPPRSNQSVPHRNRRKAGHRPPAQTSRSGRRASQRRPAPAYTTSGCPLAAMWSGRIRVAHDHDHIRTLAAGHGSGSPGYGTIGRILAHDRGGAVA